MWADLIVFTGTGIALQNFTNVYAGVKNQEESTPDLKRSFAWMKALSEWGNILMRP
jgi:hypothetical protein